MSDLRIMTLDVVGRALHFAINDGLYSTPEEQECAERALRMVDAMLEVGS